MNHQSYIPSGPAFESDTDYVVVGTGAGGASIGVSLARGGEKVTLVEAGPWRDPQDYPTSGYGFMRDMLDDWGSTITRGRAFWPVVQGRVVGGTTVINSAIVVRTPGDIFQEWEREHGFGGDALAEAVWRAQDQIYKEINVEPVPRTTWGRSNELAERAAKALGYHDHHMHRNVKDCLGKGMCLQGCRSERKQSANLNFIPETLELGGGLLSCAPVEKVIFEGRRAVGVKGRFVHPQTKKKGADFVLRARKAVIIAASATHSPVILMQSGVKSSALGSFFRAHPGAGMLGIYDEAVNMTNGATQGWASTHFRNKPGMKLETLSLPLELVASRLSGGGAQLTERLKDFPNIAMWVQAIRAKTVGRVTRSILGRPVVHYSMCDSDLDCMIEGVQILARMHFEVGAKYVIPGISGLPYSLDRDQIDLLKGASRDPRAWTSILSHLFGGCVTGVDPGRSVVDPRGWVHGYENLMVADASAIPTTLGVNPQHTIMGLARVRAWELLGAS